MEGGFGHSVAETPAPVPGGGRGIGGARARGQVDHDAGAPFEHLGEDELGQDDRCHHVGLEVAVEQLHRGVEYLVHVTGPHIAAVVHQHVDPAPPLEDGGDGRPERGPVEKVEIDRQGPAHPPLRPGRGGVQRPGKGPGVGAGDRRGVLSLLPFVDGAGADGHIESGPGQMDGDGFADPPAGPGDEGHAPGLPVDLSLVSSLICRSPSSSIIEDDTARNENPVPSLGGRSAAGAGLLDQPAPLAPGRPLTLWGWFFVPSRCRATAHDG